jgi:hypothetical protein
MLLRAGFRKHKALIAANVSKSLKKPASATIVAVEMTRKNPAGWALLHKLIVDAKVQLVNRTGPVTSIATISDVAWTKLLVHHHKESASGPSGEQVSMYFGAEGRYELKPRYKELFNKIFREEQEERKDPALIDAESKAYHEAVTNEVTSELLSEDFVEDFVLEEQAAPENTGDDEAEGLLTPAPSSSRSNLPQEEREQEEEEEMVETNRNRNNRNKRRRRTKKPSAADVAAAQALIARASGSLQQGSDDDDDDDDDDEEDDNDNDEA